MSDPDRLALLGTHFQELAALLRQASTGPLDPERVTQFALRAVPSSEHCGLALLRPERPPRTITGTSDLPMRVDALQFATGEGPCLEAAESGVVRVDDLETDERWPAFGKRCAAETGIRSLLGLQLVLEGSDVGAIHFYAQDAKAFDELDLAAAAIFAPFASLAIQSMINREQADEADAALQTSRQIGMAVGILMARQLITSEQAFQQLVTASQALNRKLREIAAEVADTGALPPLPPKR